LITACFCVFCGVFDQEQRASLLLAWIATAERLGIVVSSSIQPHREIGTARMRLVWARDGLPSDDLCAENACILQRALRPPLVIDPSDIASKCETQPLISPSIFCCESHRFLSYIRASMKTKAAGNAAVVTTFNDASFVRQLENCLRFGTPLVITDVVTVDPVLLPLLNREFRKTGVARDTQSHATCDM
jgi:dynein heavy chain 1